MDKKVFFFAGILLNALSFRAFTTTLDILDRRVQGLRALFSQ
jgi:hypothetical protein